MATLVLSYSRVDRALIHLVVVLLKSWHREFDLVVFWDRDLEPGTYWRQEFRRALDAAPQLFVFWCRHASESSEVRFEFQLALTRGKRVIPVLLDDAPLPPELTETQSIDLRRAVRHKREDDEHGYTWQSIEASLIRHREEITDAFAPFLLTD
jgi:hypothetical protein